MSRAQKFLWRLVLVLVAVAALSGSAAAAVTDGPPSSSPPEVSDAGTVASFGTFRDELRALLAGDDPDAWLCHPVATYCDLLKDTYWSLLNLVLPSTSNTLNWMYLASAVAIGLFVYAGTEMRRRPLGFRDTLLFLAPRSVYFHRSALLDYKFYFANGLLLSLISFSTMILSSAYVADAASNLLDGTFGVATQAAPPGWPDRFAYSVVLVLALDLGYYAFHRLAHAVPVLWEFHKVHHAAEVLTPVTASRNHPIDVLAEWGFTSATLGFAQGVFAHLHGHQLDALTVFNTGAVMFAFNLTANLRHTHIWLCYGRFASHIFSSPAQHQIHHSIAPDHIGKNLGRVFSLWDWIFGTLYVPSSRETLTIGLHGNEGAEYRSVWRCYVVPFVKAARLSFAGRRLAS